MEFGLEVFLKKKNDLGSIAVLSNYASLTQKFEYAWDAIAAKYKKNLKTLFSPQHGLMACEQANMIESGHEVHPVHQIPIYSLYADKRKPTPEQLKGIDTIIIDLQDIGSKYYTYIYTMAYVMEAAKELSIDVIVLDRPNPIGGKVVYGNLTKHPSFVGLYPIPIQHGMTIGELALLFNTEFKIHCSLKVIPCKSLKRHQTWRDLNLNFFPVSPNMPYYETAVVYPGGCLLEGINLSEGRGTTRPFEYVGAPFIDAYEFKKELVKEKISGVYFRETSYKPTFDKFKGEVCNGIFVHPLKNFNGYLTYLAIMKVAMKMYGEKVQWIPPPYEYEFNRLPIDIISGDEQIRLFVEQNVKMKVIDEYCKESSSSFTKIRKKYLLYS